VKQGGVGKAAENLNPEWKKVGRGGVLACRRINLLLSLRRTGEGMKDHDLLFQREGPIWSSSRERKGEIRWALKDNRKCMGIDTNL